MDKIKKIKFALRLLGLFFILLPLSSSILIYNVSSGESELLSSLTPPLTSNIESSVSASNLDIMAQAGSVDMTLPPPVPVKRAYLTFDDGPSSNTDRILDILKLYGVKATFFVNNKSGNDNILRYQRIVNEGHTIGLHSSNHVYKSVYNDEQSFVADFASNQAFVAAATGVVPVIYRFPGGSNNSIAGSKMQSFINILNSSGIAYYDWNAYDGDAVKNILPAERLAANALAGCSGRNDVMILLHDLPEKTTTPEALPAIIEGLTARGYLILPIDTSSPSSTPVFHFR